MNLYIVIDQGLGNKIYRLFIIVDLLKKKIPIEYFYQISYHESEKNQLEILFPDLMSNINKKSFKYYDEIKNKNNTYILNNINYIDYKKIINKIEKLKNNDKNIILKDYFIDYKYLYNLKSTINIIKSSFNKKLISKSKNFLIDNNINKYILIHIRHGDYKKYKKKYYILPAEYYINIINKYSNKNYNLIFITDTAHNFIKTNIINNINKNNFNKIIVSNNDLYFDFTLGILADVLILSPSTFSYTMAYLNLNNNLILEIPNKFEKNNKYNSFIDFKYFKNIHIHDITKFK